MSYVEMLVLVGRLLVGGYYLYNGLNHFMQHKNLVGYAASMNAPMPEVTVPLSGALLFVAGASILLGVYPVVGVACIVAFFLPVTYFMHAYWKVQDPQMAMMQKIQFMKNMALTGSALMFLAIPEPWIWSLMK